MMRTLNVPDGQLEVFVSVVEERHSDTEVLVWASKVAAMKYVWDQANMYAHSEEDVGDITTAEMIAGGVLLYLSYSSEGEYAWVTRQFVKFDS